ncbi:MAG TPA: hypothetical protein VD905_21910 [Flavobacteriales bacterium]|nr:hypothetical protein [Flavobacteriales bacterium]
MKQSYHPSYKHRFLLGLLTENEKSLLPKSTFSEWNNLDQKKLVGYNENDPFIKNKSELNLFHSRTEIQKAIKVYGLLLNCFQSIFNKLKDVKAVLRENKNNFIDVFNACKNSITTKQFELLSGISYKTLNRWINDKICENSIFGLCTKHHPCQLSLEEQNVIAKALQCGSNTHLFLCDIWATLLRNGELNIKLKTFYKYASLISQKIGLQKRKVKRIVKKVTAGASLQILHMDSTVIHTQDGKRFYINIIYDNYSKAILGIKAMVNPTSAAVAHNLKEVMKKYKLFGKQFQLYCDGGPENKGMVDVFLKDQSHIKKFITSFSNGIFNNVIEAFNNKFKRKWINLLDLTNHQKIYTECERFREIYNNTPQGIIGTLTPNEVLQGLNPWIDIWPALKNNITQAKNERLLVNQLSCCL